MKKLKKELQNKSSLELATICAKAALDTKAEDLVVLDVRELSSFTDYFVIMSGRSSRHVQGLAEAMESAMRSKRISASKAEGIKEGIEQGMEKGEKKAKIKIAKNLLLAKMDIEFICETTGLDQKTIEDLK